MHISGSPTHLKSHDSLLTPGASTTGASGRSQGNGTSSLANVRYAHTGPSFEMNFSRKQWCASASVSLSRDLKRARMQEEGSPSSMHSALGEGRPCSGERYRKLLTKTSVA